MRVTWTDFNSVFWSPPSPFLPFPPPPLALFVYRKKRRKKRVEMRGRSPLSLFLSLRVATRGHHKKEKKTKVFFFTVFFFLYVPIELIPQGSSVSPHHFLFPFLFFPSDATLIEKEVGNLLPTSPSFFFFFLSPTSLFYPLREDGKGHRARTPPLIFFFFFSLRLRAGKGIGVLPSHGSPFFFSFFFLFFLPPAHGKQHDMSFALEGTPFLFFFFPSWWR